MPSLVLAHSNPPLSHERRGAETSRTEVDIFPSRSVVHLKQWRRTGGLFRGDLFRQISQHSPPPKTPSRPVFEADAVCWSG